MEIRWIIHKRDGKTITSDWNSNEESFRKNWSDSIASVQLQVKEGKLYTLSSRKNSNCKFWQTDDFLLNPNTKQTDMVARRIFKSLGNDNWLELKLCDKNKRPVINIINKKIKVM